MIVLAAASFLGAMLEAAFLVLLTSIVMALATGKNTFTLLANLELSATTGLAVTLVAVVARLALSVLAAQVTAVLGARVRATQRRRVARAYLDTAWAVQQAEASGQLQELLTTFVGRVNTAMLALTQMITASLSLFAFMAAGLAVDALSTLAVLAALGALALVLAPIRRRIRRTATVSGEADVGFATTVAEVGSLGQEMRTFGVTPALVARVDDAIDVSTDLARRVQFLFGVLAPIYTFLAYLAVIGGVATLQLLGTGDLATLGAVMLLMLRSLSYGQQLVAVSGQLASAIPAIEQIDETVADYARQPAPNGVARPAAATPLVFEAVTFSYTAERPALLNLNLQIEKGEMLGVIGPSGAGKSTIAQLVLGLREPTSGRVAVAGVDLVDVNRDWWTKRVAFVPQDPVLLTGTVAENIRFFRDGLSDTDLRCAAAKANVLADIDALPQGFATHLGERGGRLSGGQRQRLSIARALVGHPEVLILDEPTSALDGQSESLIRDTLAGLQGAVTIVLIAHRMSTLDLCDRLLVIESGRPTGLDTPERLRQSNAFYNAALATAGLA